MTNPYVVITYILAILAAIVVAVNASLCIWTYTNPKVTY
jgi:hypothetical protein